MFSSKHWTPNPQQQQQQQQQQKPAQPKERSVLHLLLHHLSVVEVLFCSLKKGITPKIRLLCFVMINSVLLNLLYVWILL